MYIRSTGLGKTLLQCKVEVGYGPILRRQIPLVGDKEKGDRNLRRVSWRMLRMTQ